MQWLILVMVTVLLAPTAHSAPKKTITWSAQRADRTRLFLLTEHGFDIPISGNDTPGHISNTNFSLVWTAGLMCNISQNSSVGITASAFTEKINTPFAVSLRYRHWILDQLCVDVSAGRTLFDLDPRDPYYYWWYPYHGADFDGSGWNIDGAVSLVNWVGLYLRYVSIPYKDYEFAFESTEPTYFRHAIKNMHFGVRFHHKLGLAAALIVPISYLVHEAMGLRK